MKLTPKEEFNLQAETVAQGFEAEYPGEKLDPEYTETGYSDLPREAREAGSWTEFHAKVAKKLEAMRGE
jgi:hypothetical protein